MNPAQAVWVRTWVWTEQMRGDYEKYPDTVGFDAHHCECQFGLTPHCEEGRCGECEAAGGPQPGAEATINASPEGRYPMLWKPSPFTHPATAYGTASGVRERPDIVVHVWLADRVCRWFCPCSCHPPYQPPSRGTVAAAAVLPEPEPLPGWATAWDDGLLFNLPAPTA